MILIAALLLAAAAFVAGWLCGQLTALRQEARRRQQLMAMMASGPDRRPAT